MPNLHKPSVLVTNSVELGVTISRLGDDPSSLLLLKILSEFGYFPVRVWYTIQTFIDLVLGIESDLVCKVDTFESVS